MPPALPAALRSLTSAVPGRAATVRGAAGRILGSRGLVTAARAGVLAAVVAGSGAFAANALTAPAAEPLLAVAAADDARSIFDNSSRSLTRATLDPDAGSVVIAASAGLSTREESTVAEIPFEVIEQPDAQLAVGKREVLTPGVPGSETILFRVTYQDGVEVGREEYLRTTTEPVAEVVRVGSEPRTIARAMVAARGWGAEQFTCLDRLWTKESNWNPSAENASSGAYGIPQALPGSKMGTVAADWRTNPATQITWGLNYIAGRYGTPCGAWSHSQAVGWY